MEICIRPAIMIFFWKSCWMSVYKRQKVETKGPVYEYSDRSVQGYWLIFFSQVTHSKRKDANAFVMAFYESMPVLHHANSGMYVFYYERSNLWLRQVVVHLVLFFLCICTILSPFQWDSEYWTRRYFPNNLSCAHYLLLYYQP